MRRTVRRERLVRNKADRPGGWVWFGSVGNGGRGGGRSPVRGRSHTIVFPCPLSPAGLTVAADGRGGWDVCAHVLVLSARRVVVTDRHCRCKHHESDGGDGEKKRLPQWVERARP